MNKYRTNITRGFCMQWTKSKAIQEYVSNMLDQGDYSFEFGEDYIDLINHNVKVSHKALLLGLSDKTFDKNTRGMFGCGIPQSMAALLSQDVEITIHNADIMWTPEFSYSNEWKEDVLVIHEDLSNNPSSDYVVNISNLTEEDIDEIRQRCLEFQDRDVLFSTDLGDLIDGSSGEIYVGDIFVTQNSDFKYSYNFKPSVVTLNQDRNAVDPWELRKLTAKLISQVEDEDFVKEAIKSNRYDTNLITDHYYLDKSYGSPTHSAVEVMGEEFVEDNQGCVITDDYSDHQHNKKVGTPSVYNSNSVEVKSIQQSKAYEESILDTEIIEKPTPYDVIENLKDHMIFCLDNKLTSEQLTEVEGMLQSVLDLSEYWSGDTEDGLPF